MIIEYNRKATDIQHTGSKIHHMIANFFYAVRAYTIVYL